MKANFILILLLEKEQRRSVFFARLEGQGLDRSILEDQRGFWVFPLKGQPVTSASGDFLIDKDIFSEIEHLPYASQSSADWNNLEKRWIKRGTTDFKSLLDSICVSPYYYFAYMAKAIENYNDSSSDFRFIFFDEGTYYVISNVQYNFREAFTNSSIMPAFRDPYNQMRIVNYSWYGKLLRKTWEKASMEKQVSEGMQGVLKSLSDIGQPVFQDLTDDINSKLNIGFGGAKVRFQFINSSRQDFHKNVKVFVDDGVDDIISLKGSGIQSAFLIGLFTYYCLTNHNTSILVVEEPEVFLHPHARRSVSRRLDEFVRLKAHEGKTNQVIVTTHSDEIVQTGGVETISLIRKAESGTQSKTFIFSEDFDQKEVGGLLKSGLSEMLFADKVLICEGVEEFLIPRVADIISSKPGYFDDSNISVVSSGGKGTIATLARLLGKLGIEWFAVTDFDFLDNTSKLFIRKCGTPSSTLLGKIEDFHRKVQEEIGRDISKAFKGLSLDKLPPNLRTMANDIIENFKTEYGLWVLRNGDFESYVTEYGRDNLFNEEMKVDPSKLISVCMDIEIDVENFFDVEEYKDLLTTLKLVDV